MSNVGSHEAAFEAMVTQSYQLLVNWLAQRLNDREAAADIAQDACAQLWERRARIRFWSQQILFSQAKYLLIDFYRRRRPSMVPLDDVRGLGQNDMWFEQVDAEQDARAVLERMTPNERAVVDLRLEGWRVPEIAKALGIPEGTVKSRLNQAKRAIYRTGPPAPRQRRPA